MFSFQERVNTELRGSTVHILDPRYELEHMSHADRLRTVSLEYAGTEMEHMPIPAPEKVGFQEAIAVRDVGVLSSCPTSRQRFDALQ